jgi:hypothetical protein
MPPDTELDETIEVLQTGLEGKHMKAGAITATELGAGAVTAEKIADAALAVKLFTADDASETGKSVTLTGAKVGDSILTVINLTDLTDVSADFETTITVVNKIQQTSADLTAKVCFVLMIAKGA